MHGVVWKQRCIFRRKDDEHHPTAFRSMVPSPVYRFLFLFLLALSFLDDSRSERNKETRRDQKTKSIKTNPPVAMPSFVFCVCCSVQSFSQLLESQIGGALLYFAQAKIHTHTHPEKGKTQKVHISTTCQSPTPSISYMLPRLFVPATTTSDTCVFVPIVISLSPREGPTSPYRQTQKYSIHAHPFVPCPPLPKFAKHYLHQCPFFHCYLLYFF